ncbi:hypothetical protein [Streptomyces kronopolitis]
MAGVRGKAQSGRSGKYTPDEPARAAAILQPHEDAHKALLWLVADMPGISQAEIVRKALVAFKDQRMAARPRAALQGGQIAS